MTSTTSSGALADLGWLQQFAARIAREDPEDLVQEVALAASREETPIGRGWLATALRNRLRMRHRSDTARRAREAASAPATSITQESTVDRLVVLRALVESLEALAEDDRRIVVERFFDGRSAPEIGKRLGMPAATVRSRLRRTLARLRRTLDTRFEGERVVWTAAVVSPGTLLVLGETTLGVGAMFAWLSAAKLAAAVVLAVVLGLAAWLSTRPSPPSVREGHPLSANEDLDDVRAGSPTQAVHTPELGSDMQRLWAARRDRMIASKPSAEDDREPTRGPEPSADLESAIDDAMRAQSQAYQTCTNDLGIPLVGATVLRSRIRGAPDVGTIYEDLDIVGHTDAHAELVECVQEHMYGYLGEAPDEPFVAARTLTTLGAPPEDLDGDAWGQRMIDTIVTAHLDDVLACSEALPSPISATLMLTFEDQPAAEVEVTAEGIPESVRSCLRDQAEAWPFPRHRQVLNRSFESHVLLGAPTDQSPAE